jgi:hypothetical protein
MQIGVRRHLQQICETCADSANVFVYGALASEPTPFPLLPALARNLTIRAYQLMLISQNPEKLERAKSWIYENLNTRQAQASDRPDVSIRANRRRSPLHGIDRADRQDRCDSALGNGSSLESSKSTPSRQAVETLREGLLDANISRDI